MVRAPASVFGFVPAHLPAVHDELLGDGDETGPLLSQAAAGSEDWFTP